MLVVCALVNRYYIVDLQPDLSVIRRYLERGIDVYIIDWGDPAPSDRYETMGDEVDYIDAMVDVIRKRSGLQKINLHGYCMGGTLSVIHASLHPEKIKSLVVQAAPIDFSKDEGILNLWARYIDTDEIVDTFGNVPASFMNLGFLLVNPVRLMIDKYVNFYEKMNDKDFVGNFMRMEKWIFDSPDLPGESYRQFLKDLYQKNLLVKGELVVNEERVSLKQVRAPLLSLVADTGHARPSEFDRPPERACLESREEGHEVPRRSCRAQCEQEGSQGVLASWWLTGSQRIRLRKKRGEVFRTSHVGPYCAEALGGSCEPGAVGVDGGLLCLCGYLLPRQCCLCEDVQGLAGCFLVLLNLVHVELEQFRVALRQVCDWSVLTSARRARSTPRSECRS